MQGNKKVTTYLQFKKKKHVYINIYISLNMCTRDM